jgi:hypothetical protein
MNGWIRATSSKRQITPKANPTGAKSAVVNLIQYNITLPPPLKLPRANVRRGIGVHHILIMKKLFVIVLAVVSSFVWAAHADVSQDKRIEIEKMLRLTGTEKLMGQMMTQLISGLKAQQSGVPEEFWIKFEKKMNLHKLIDEMIPLYDKYYSLEDLKAANAFYASPAGQRILKVTPQLMQESIKLGQAWGKKMGEEAAQELKNNQ